MRRRITTGGRGRCPCASIKAFLGRFRYGSSTPNALMQGLLSIYAPDLCHCHSAASAPKQLPPRRQQPPHRTAYLVETAPGPPASRSRYWALPRAPPRRLVFPPRISAPVGLRNRTLFRLARFILWKVPFPTPIAPIAPLPLSPITCRCMACPILRGPPPRPFRGVVYRH